MEVDFSKVKKPEARPIEPGRYLVEIETVNEKKSGKGKKMFSVVFKIVDDTEFSGRKIFENFVVTETSLWKMKSLLEALNVDVSGKVDLSLKTLKPLAGRKLGATLTNETKLYQGEYRNRPKITKMEPLG